MKFVLTFLFLLSQNLLASQDFYSLSYQSMSGKNVAMSKYKGKTVIIVNTASKCGYTGQFEDLQKVYSKFKEKNVAIIGFPSRSFKQEYKSSEDAANFCKLNYGVKFPMTKIVEVTGSKTHPIFKFLTRNDPEKQGDVSWNFEKFIVSKNGKVVKRFRSSVSPQSKEFIKTLEKNL